MPSTLSNRTRHRTQIVAEAVVSAYIHELAQPSRQRERGRLRDADLAAARGAGESSPLRARPLDRAHGRARGQAPARRRRQALELAS